MEKIGIVGGIGPASTLDYYRDIINGYREKTGLDEYPLVVVDSINMSEMIRALDEQAYGRVVDQVVASIDNLAAAGATVAAIASNTPHIVYPEIAARAAIPVVSIVEETCRYIQRCGYRRVVVLGTRFTMGSGLYTRALAAHSIEAFVPDEAGIAEVHGLIFPRLEQGIVVPEDKRRMLAIAEEYIARQHADALVLGCTEIPLMIHDGDASVPCVNTTQVHIDAMVRRLTE